MQKLTEVTSILDKYHYIAWAEHQLVGFSAPISGTDIEEKDLKRLKELGVFYDGNTKSLCLWIV